MKSRLPRAAVDVKAFNSHHFILEVCTVRKQAPCLLRQILKGIIVIPCNNNLVLDFKSAKPLVKVLKFFSPSSKGKVTGNEQDINVFW